MAENFITKIFKSNREKLFFPGQTRGEKIIFFTRRHPLSFLGPFLFAFFMAILPFLLYLIVTEMGIVVLSVLGEKLMIVLGGSYLLFVLGFFLAAWIDYYLDVMILTDFRLVDITQNVLFSRTVAEANLTDVEDVNAEVKGVLPTFFHYGTVFVQTAGTARNFEFKSIPDPYGTSKLVVDLHQKSLLEEEEKETTKIEESFTKKREEGEEVTPDDIHQAAHDIARHRHIPKGPEIKEDPSPTPKILPPEEPKPETREENNNSVSHDDLEKGGGAEF